jgi:hypothetical protein
MPNKTFIKEGVKHFRLTVIKELAARIRKNGQERRVLLCKCDCGVIKEVLYDSFKAYRVKSCGCYQKDVVKKGHFAKKHGLSNHPLFSVWRKMKDRCYNPKSKGYKYYGGRGIIICDEWLSTPNNFIDWALNNGWDKELQIDRRNCNGNYEPSNCRFITQYENIMNRRCTKNPIKIKERSHLLGFLN